jgi:hypothetical protein
MRSQPTSWLLLCVTAIIMVGSFACQRSQPDRSAIKPSVYTSKELGFTVSLPQGWVLNAVGTAVLNHDAVNAKLEKEANENPPHEQELLKATNRSDGLGVYMQEQYTKVDEGSPELQATKMQDMYRARRFVPIDKIRTFKIGQKPVALLQLAFDTQRPPPLYLNQLIAISHNCIVTFGYATSNKDSQALAQKNLAEWIAFN